MKIQPVAAAALLVLAVAVSAGCTEEYPAWEYPRDGWYIRWDDDRFTVLTQTTDDLNLTLAAEDKSWNLLGSRTLVVPATTQYDVVLSGAFGSYYLSNAAPYFLLLSGADSGNGTVSHEIQLDPGTYHLHLVVRNPNSISGDQPLLFNMTWQPR